MHCHRSRSLARTAVTTLTALACAGAVALAPARRPADAFCGFYVAGSNERLLNNATQVALMRQGTRTVLTMSNNYQGPAQDFAMVVPVPIVLQRENVRTLPHNVFEHLEQLTAPRLVEYWEQDPCAPEAEFDRATAAFGGVTARRSRAGGAAEGLGVRIEAQFVVGEYQIVVLSATQSTGLETWLHQNHYNIPAGAAEYLAPYIREQWKFFVARVDIARVQRRPDGTARLSPLRFHYDSAEFRLPVRLGLLNAPEAQDLIVYVLHPSARFEAANYRNAFIPTNLDVADGVRTQFPAFYAALFDRTLRAAGGRAVVTEYAWATNTCDPCPTPALTPGELATLGGDALGAAGAPSPYNMVVTRLHTRYDRATLTEDLVFREASGVVGGREFVSGPDGGLERGAQPSPAMNNFQARYAIRHPWTGPVACAAPRRGRWGGPPGGAPRPGPQAARDLASAPRGQVDLAAMVQTRGVPELDATQGAQPGGSVRMPTLPGLDPTRIAPGALQQLQQVQPVTRVPQGGTTGATDPNSAGGGATGGATGSATPARSNCACRAAGSSARGGRAWWAGALAAVIAAATQRRRTAHRRA